MVTVADPEEEAEVAEAAVVIMAAAWARLPVVANWAAKESTLPLADRDSLCASRSQITRRNPSSFR